MAAKTIRTCDVCGTDASTAATLTIDGATTEIDLCAKHAKELTAATKAYASVGRTTGRSRTVTKRSVAKKAATSKPSRTAARKKSPSAAIRAWANANGVPVGLKGVVRQEVVDAYNAARKKK